MQLTENEAQLIPQNQKTGRTFPSGGGTKNAARLKRALTYPAKRLQEQENKLAGLQSDLTALNAAGGGAFEHQERLAHLRQREKELDAELNSLGEDGQAFEH